LGHWSGAIAHQGRQNVNEGSAMNSKAAKRKGKRTGIASVKDEHENGSKTRQAGIGKVVSEVQHSSELKTEKLAYILEMLKELHKISATMDESLVTYLIEMAILEANTVYNMLENGSEIKMRGSRQVD
jgi:hypothetical protein